jgi:hypothetical protein
MGLVNLSQPFNFIQSEVMIAVPINGDTAPEVGDPVVSTYPDQSTGRTLNPELFHA